jgi:hypothetical protein
VSAARALRARATAIRATFEAVIAASGAIAAGCAELAWDEDLAETKRGQATLSLFDYPPRRREAGQIRESAHRKKVKG